MRNHILSSKYQRQIYTIEVHTFLFNIHNGNYKISQSTISNLKLKYCKKRERREQRQPMHTMTKFRLLTRLFEWWGVAKIAV